MTRQKRIGILLLISFILIINGCNNINLPKEKPFTDTGVEQNTLVIDTESIRDRLQNVHHYNIDIQLDTEKHKIKGVQKVSYINNTKKNLEEIYFHIYPNAFKERETAPFLSDDFSQAYGKTFKPGYIHIGYVKINGEKINFEVSGMGETLLKIPLHEPLSPERRLEIKIAYEIQIPSAKERFGVYEEVYNVGNWYPIAAVYDDEGWNLDPYYPIGDPFYSEVANYDVTIRTPMDVVVAATGNIKKNEIIEGKREWQIEARLVRDFAWCASPKFHVEEKLVGDTVTKMYHLNNSMLVRKKAMEYTENAIKIFNEVFGKYPYGQYSVVETNFSTGMEFPGLVYIGKQYYKNNYLSILETIIVHETAHQWWYGVVGNDQIDEAWLDESLATYSEVIYKKELQGSQEAKKYHENSSTFEYKVSKERIKDDAVLKPLDEFQGWDDYGVLVYDKGAMMINEIQKSYGWEKLYKILSTYYERFQFDIVKTDDFIKVCEEVLKEDKNEFFNKWLLGITN